MNAQEMLSAHGNALIGRWIHTSTGRVRILDLEVDDFAPEVVFLARNEAGEEIDIFDLEEVAFCS